MGIHLRYNTFMAENNSYTSVPKKPTSRVGQTPVASTQMRNAERFRTIDAIKHSKSLERSSTTTRAPKQQTRLVTQKIEKANAEKQQSQTSTALKGGYILFFLVLGLAVGKDLFDIVVTLLDAIGAGLSATFFGSVVGVPLIVFIEAFSKYLTIFIDGTIMFYFWIIGGRFGQRLVVMSIGAIIDAIPFLAILPLTTLTFVFAFLAGRVVKKVESKAGGTMVTSAIAKKI